MRAVAIRCHCSGCPIYAGVFVHATASAASQLNLNVWQPHYSVVNAPSPPADYAAAVTGAHA